MLFIRNKLAAMKITKEQLKNFINENYDDEYGTPGKPDYWGVEDDMSDLDKYRSETDDYRGYGDESVSPGYLGEEGGDSAVDYSEEISNWDSLSDRERQDIIAALKTDFERSLNEGREVEITEKQLSKLVNEGVERLHKRTLAENRLEEINQELNALNNPEAWQQARDNAQAELEKKNINWQSITQRIGGLISEMSFRDVEIPVEAPKDTATIEANTQWKKVQKESVAEIMGRASDLMAEAKKKYQDISK